MVNIFIPEELIEKCRRGETLIPEQQVVLDNWLNENEEHRRFFDDLTQPERFEKLKNEVLRTDFESMSIKIEAALDRESLDG